MTPTTLTDLLLRNAAASPDSIAVVSSRHDAFSYRELAAQIDGFGAGLRGAGFRDTSKIAIALSDAPQAALAIVSVSCHAIAVPLDPNLTPVETEQRLRLLDVDAIILLAGEDSPARRVAEGLEISVIEGIPSSEGGLGLELVTPQNGEDPVSTSSPAPAPGSTAFILQSSGTTAEPKRIPYSHANMLAAAARVKGWFDLDKTDRCLSVTPVHYCHGLTLTVFAPLLSGGSIAFPRSASLIDIDAWFLSLEPTWFSASPTLHQAIADKVKPRGTIDHELRFAVSGGAPLSTEIQRDLQATLGVPVLEHYGATEAGQISSNRPHPGEAREGTCGVPPADTVQVVGEDGAALAPGEFGEILISGPTVIEGYLNAPDLNRASFVDGWFRTGDIGGLDEDGFLTVRGRLREIINRGGEKISPMEIEAALLRHPDIAEAAAFAIPHPRLGEDVGAAVVLHPQLAEEPADLRAFLSSQLAWFKVPRRVRVVPELPKGNTGKVQRRKLRENAGDG